MIVAKDGLRKYYDRNGKEIKEGNFVKYPNGDVRYVIFISHREYTVSEDALGYAVANNPDCAYGVMPFSQEETSEVEVVEYEEW